MDPSRQSVSFFEDGRMDGRRLDGWTYGRMDAWTRVIIMTSTDRLSTWIKKHDKNVTDKHTYRHWRNVIKIERIFHVEKNKNRLKN